MSFEEGALQCVACFSTKDVGAENEEQRRRVKILGIENLAGLKEFKLYDVSRRMWDMPKLAINAHPNHSRLQGNNCESSP